MLRKKKYTRIKAFFVFTGICFIIKFACEYGIEVLKFLF